MVVRGRIHNGVVVLDAGVHLPEGHEVTVLAPGAPADLALPSVAQRDPASATGEAVAAITPLNASSGRHSVQDISPVSLGTLLSPLGPDDDLLGEMLEGRS
jgi:hypothetical protein